MRGAIPLLPQYASIVWCSVKSKAQRQFYLYLYLYHLCSLEVLSGNSPSEFRPREKKLRTKLSVLLLTSYTISLGDCHRNLNLRWFSKKEWDGCVIRNAYEISVRKPVGKRPLGRSRCRWEDNIRMGLKEIGWEGEDWMHLAQNRDRWQDLVNTIMKLRVP
jgi:hypothetical protein